MYSEAMDFGSWSRVLQSSESISPQVCVGAGACCRSVPGRALDLCVVLNCHPLKEVIRQECSHFHL